MNLVRIGRGKVYVGQTTCGHYPHYALGFCGKCYHIHCRKLRRTKQQVRYAELKYKYGVTLESYNILLEKQGGGCAVCGVAKAGNGKGDKYLDVDHNHTTGKVRGLLCRRCNLTLGVLERNRERIIKIEEYLIKTD